MHPNVVCEKKKSPTWARRVLFGVSSLSFRPVNPSGFSCSTMSCLNSGRTDLARAFDTRAADSRTQHVV